MQKNQVAHKAWRATLFSKTLFVPSVKEGPLSVPGFTFMYNIWKDAGIRTQVAATAARWPTYELHTLQYCGKYIELNKEQRAHRATGSTVVARNQVTNKKLL